MRPGIGNLAEINTVKIHEQYFTSQQNQNCTNKKQYPTINAYKNKRSSVCANYDQKLNRETQYTKCNNTSQSAETINNFKMKMFMVNTM